MGGLSRTDVRRERIPLLWSTIRETALAKGFCSNMGGMKYSCVLKNEAAWNHWKGVHSGNVREIGRR